MTTPTAPTDQIENTIFTALEQFGAESSALRRDATLEELDVDSLDLVELAQVIEDEYKVEVTSQDVQNVSTVGDVIDLVASRLS
jgi:acyl carrier protein